MSGEPRAGAQPRLYPMSREQESQWLDDLVAEGPSRYLESWACRLTGQLDIGAVEWAISQIVARHEVLRSRLTERSGELVQVVTDSRPVPVTQVSCTPDGLSAELSRITAEPLNLDEAPLRPWLVRIPPDEFVLVVQFHHAVIDDWALNIFQGELVEFYTARLTGRPPSLEPVRMQLGDFAVAQRATEFAQADLAYWRDRVRGVPTSCTFPPDRPGPEALPHRAERQSFPVSPELARGVRAMSRKLRTTPYTVFAGAMAVLLREHTEPEDVVIGIPVSLRGTADVDHMMGCLSSLLPLRLSVARNISFRELTDAAKAEVIGAIKHRAVPYSVLVRMTRLGVNREVPPPLCHVVLVVDDMRWEPLSFPGARAERIYIPPGRAKFDVCVTLVADNDGGYTGLCDYDADVYQADTMERMVSQYLRLLGSLIAAPDEPVALAVGSAAEPCVD
jgi:Condensation domain